MARYEVILSSTKEVVGYAEGSTREEAFANAAEGNDWTPTKNHNELDGYYLGEEIPVFVDENGEEYDADYSGYLRMCWESGREEHKQSVGVIKVTFKPYHEEN